jgi:hypothetical protein
MKRLNDRWKAASDYAVSLIRSGYCPAALANREVAAITSLIDIHCQLFELQRRLAIGPKCVVG